MKPHWVLKHDANAEHPSVAAVQQATKQARTAESSIPKACMKAQHPSRNASCSWSASQLAVYCFNAGAQPHSAWGKGKTQPIKAATACRLMPSAAA